MSKIPSGQDINEGLPGASGAPQVVAPRVTEEVPLNRTGTIIANVGELVGQEGRKLDALRAEDALNQIRQARLDLTLGDQGAYSVKGGNVLDPTYAQGFRDQLSSRVDSIMEGLSPNQRAMLQPHADTELRGFQGDVLRHSMAEAEAYKGLVREGTIKTAQSAGTEQWNDPVAFDKALVDLDTVVNGIALEKGVLGRTDDEKNTIMQMRATAASPLFVGAITKAIDAKTPEGLARAEALYQQGRMAIEPNARLRIREALDAAKDAQAVQVEAKTYVTNTVLPMNSDKSRLKGAINFAESGNRSVDPRTGDVMLGPVVAAGANKGDRAVGAEQLMPKTAEGEAKQAGIPWDESLFRAKGKDGDAYRASIQDAYLSRLMKKYDRPDDIFAAYNAGEGNVEDAHRKFEKFKKLEALALTDKSVTPILPAGFDPAQVKNISWMDFLPQPAVTKAYVEKAARQFKAGADFVKPSTAEIETAMRNKFPNRPDLVASTAKIVEHQIGLVETQRKGEIEGTKDSLFKLMAQGQTIDQVPTTMLNSLPPKDRQEVESTFTEFLSKRKRDSDQGFLSQINADPNYVARLPNAMWNGKARLMLSEYDWQRFDKQRSSILGGNVEQSSILDVGTVKRVLDSRLRLLDIEPAPNKHDARGQQIVNSAREVVDQSILARQAQIGRKMTEPEITQHIDSMFASKQIIKGVSIGGYQITNDRDMVSLTADYSDVPSKDVDAIRSEFARRGVKEPTRLQILTVYKQKKAGLL